MDRSTRNLSIITLLVLVIFLALNNIATRSDLAAWGSVLFFLLLAVGIWYYDRLRRRGIDDSEAAEAAYIEPLVYDHAAPIGIPDSIELVAPNPGTVLKPEHPHAPVIEAAPPAPAPATPAAQPREVAPAVSPPPTADVPEAAPAHSEFPAAPLHEDEARAPMPSDVLNATPAPVKEVKSSPAPAPTTTTNEEKTAPPPSAPAPMAKSEPAPAAPKVEEKAAPPPAAEVKPAPSKAKPAASPKAASAPAKADDLKVIEGIGPKMEKALNAAGISTFAQLAAASEDQINAAIVAAGMRFAPSVPTWAEQASYAAKGDTAGLEAYQKTLKGGRKGKK
jgi:predicted flap endonuclease-1-like 5' DNA nuclease